MPPRSRGAGYAAFEPLGQPVKATATTVKQERFELSLKRKIEHPIDLTSDAGSDEDPFGHAKKPMDGE